MKFWNCQRAPALYGTLPDSADIARVVARAAVVRH